MPKIQRSDRPNGQATQQFTPPQATQSIPTQRTAVQRPAQATQSIPAQRTTQATQSVPAQGDAIQSPVHATQTIHIRRSDLQQAAQARAAQQADREQSEAGGVPPVPPKKQKGSPEPEEKPRKGKKSKKRGRHNWIYNVAMLVFGAVFVVSAGLLGKRYWDDHQAQQEFGSLQSLIDTTATSTTGTEEAASGNSAKFAALREQNSDCIGWISIEDTPLDLPVMYKPSEKDYYLRRGFDQQYSVYGVPYIDEKCTLGANRQSENLIVYGHHMKTGTIFGSLQGYKKADYYTEHPYVELDTIYGDAKYEVFGAFAIDVVDDQTFLYNQYTDMDEDTYNSYVQQVLSRSDVDTGIVPTYGEQLLTLSTCDYSSENGRYVVVARRVSE